MIQISVRNKVLCCTHLGRTVAAALLSAAQAWQRTVHPGMAALPDALSSLDDALLGPRRSLHAGPPAADLVASNATTHVHTAARHAIRQAARVNVLTLGIVLLLAAVMSVTIVYAMRLKRTAAAKSVADEAEAIELAEQAGELLAASPLRRMHTPVRIRA